MAGVVDRVDRRIATLLAATFAGYRGDPANLDVPAG
jgi:hypothetical protein